MQDFWREELEALFLSIARSHSESGPVPRALEEAMVRLRSVAQERFQWELPVGRSESGADDESLEEGEDAPVIVDL